MKSHFFPLLSLILTSATAFAATVDEQFAQADWFERPVAEGVVWRHYHFEDLFNSRQSISVVIADITRPDVSVAIPYKLMGTRLERVSTMVPSQVPNAVAAVNGSYFRTREPFGTTTFMRIDGELIQGEALDVTHFGLGGAIAMDSSGVVEMVTTRPEAGWASLDMPNILVSGPSVVRAGEVIDNMPVGGHCTTRHPRTAVGITADGKLLLVTIDGRTDFAAGTNCNETGEVMRALGAVEAVNFDGGGSTTLWVAGEDNNGVVNFPSDNGRYDHAGERSCADAIAVIAPPLAALLEHDARVTAVEYSERLLPGEEGEMIVRVRNIGSQTWDSESVTLEISRPRGGESAFANETWPSPHRPAVISPAKVASGEEALFRFPLARPDVEQLTTFRETYALYRDGVRFGPPDNAVRVQIDVYTEAVEADVVFMESREPGIHHQWFSGSGWSRSGIHTTAEDLAGNVGQMYSATRRNAVGVRTGRFTPMIATHGIYEVHVAWGDGPLRQPAITYAIHHVGGATEFIIDQAATANEWIKVGESFEFAAGIGSTMIEISNKNTADVTVSGNMYAGAVKLVLIEKLGE